MNISVAQDERIADLAENYLERKRRGEEIKLDSFIQDYPELADELADYIHLLVLMDGTKPPQTRQTTRGRIGDYRLERMIGQGGMGFVFEAIQESLGRKVALKLMKQTASDPAVLARFIREARAAARLHHTNIVGVYGVGIDQGEHYLALQYVPGISLDRLLHRLRKSSSGSTLKMKKPGSTIEGMNDNNSERQGQTTSSSDDSTLADQIIRKWTRLRVEEPDQYFRQMARLIANIGNALGHAHAHGILHRDVKPSNLLLDDEGVIWITDFGLARMSEEADLTQTGQMVGTLRYLAPERLRKREDHYSDQYSLAATLYELLTLKPVYDAQTSEEIMHKITTEEPVPPVRHVPSLPIDLQTIILKGLSRDPERRYASAVEFGDDLRRFAEGQPIRARRLNALQTAYRWAKRNPVVAGLSAAVFISLLAGLIVSTAFFFKAEKDRIEAQNAEYRASYSAEQSKKALSAMDSVLKFFLSEVLEQASPLKKGRNVTLLEALQDATSSVPKRFGHDPVLEALIHNYLGELYRDIGLAGDAVSQHRQAASLRVKELGEESPEAIGSLHNQALAELDAGKLKEAEPLLKKLLPHFEKQYGIEDHRTVTARNNLAAILEKLGKYDEAIPMQKQALLEAQEHHGLDDDITLTCQSNLGLLLAKANKLDEAFNTLSELIDRLRERFPPEHHRVLTARTNLLTIAFQKKDYQRALPQAREIYDAQKKSAGENDPTTLMYQVNLGAILNHIDLVEAEKVMQDVTARMEAVLKERHPNRLTAYHNLGSTYFMKKQYQQADPWFEKSLAGRKVILPENHPERLQTIIFLGQSKLAQKQYDLAEKYFREALEVQDKMPIKNLLMMISRRNLAQCLVTKGDEKQAEALLQENLKQLGQEKANPAEWKDTRKLLVDLYDKQGRKAEAEQLRK